MEELKKLKETAYYNIFKIMAVNQWGPMQYLARGLLQKGGTAEPRAERGGARTGAGEVQSPAAHRPLH